VLNFIKFAFSECNFCKIEIGESDNYPTKLTTLFSSTSCIDKFIQSAAYDVHLIDNTRGRLNVYLSITMAQKKPLLARALRPASSLGVQSTNRQLPRLSLTSTTRP
jgi:hypothetical protein